MVRTDISVFFKKAIDLFRRLPKSAILSVPVAIIAYYIIGSLMCEKIDRDLDFEIKKQKGYTFVQTSADLIKREIDDHMFAPSLPFIFPVFILDNMPSFQRGIIESLSNIIHAAAQKLDSTELNKADSFLMYPSDIWLFSKTKDFKLSPSSVAQYRKARRSLLAFNENVSPQAEVLKEMLIAVENDLDCIEKELQKNIEIQTNFKSDDVFYRAEGRLYADYMLLKSIGQDMVFDVSPVLGYMEKALLLSPPVVRNGKFGSSFTPNHLLELAYLTVKSNQSLKNTLEGLKNAD